jgi:hypothetical protein
VAVGHSYPSHGLFGAVGLSYTSVCIEYDEPTRLATFEVRGKEAGQLGRLLAGLPLDSLLGHETKRLGSEGGHVAELPTND